jgi:hypothetical protein
MMERFNFVTSVTGFNRHNLQKEDDDNDDDDDMTYRG